MRKTGLSHIVWYIVFLWSPLLFADQRDNDKESAMPSEELLEFLGNWQEQDVNWLENEIATPANDAGGLQKAKVRGTTRTND